ncbi:hypothetical protein PsorP6_007899 [Peronosclerospora sorghi]|uniref:Uncharacterized protein n=1 Tax=Peronosclerospora sorghi TaxID=230839 RepID=A0ACC0WA15_9STRA|nr:hypothetical protein PsorP6_007899 [Peronosclerospora sorghi]
MKSQSEAQSTEVEQLQERIQSLDSELQELQIHRESDAETAEKTTSLGHTLGYSNCCPDTAKGWGKQLGAKCTKDEISLIKDRHGAELATKDDIISTLKSNLEEVMAAYKRLKGHAKHVQDKLTHDTANNDRLMTSLEALKAQDVALAAELEAIQVELAASRAQSSVMSEESCEQSERAAETVAQYEAQIEVLMKRVSVSDEVLAQTRRQHAIEVQKQKETLQSALAQKDGEIERMIHGMQRVEEELAHAQGAREEPVRAHEAERKEWKLQCVVDLEKQRTCLERHVQAETERSQAALAALEMYKKRAHCALKKTSRERKQQVSDAVARTSELQREMHAVTSCITGLESELKDARRCLEEEAARRGELERVQAEVTRLNDVLARIETPLCAQITELTAGNDALEQRVRVMEDERKELACLMQAAVAAVESGRRSLSLTDSSSEKERRSTTSSLRSFDFEGSVPTLLHTTIEDNDAATQKIHRICSDATIDAAAVVYLMLLKTVGQCYLIGCHYRDLFKPILTECVENTSEYGVLLQILSSPLEQVKAEILREATTEVERKRDSIFPVVMACSNAEIPLQMNTYEETYGEDLVQVLFLFDGEKEESCVDAVITGA